MMDRSVLNKLLRPLVLENPLCIRLIGLTPVLACSDSFSRALPMCVVFVLVMVSTALICSLTRHLIPLAHRLLFDLVAIATVISIIAILLQRFALAAYVELGIYLPVLAGTALLWTVAEESLVKSVHLAARQALWYASVAAVSMLLLTAVREALGLVSPLPTHAAGGLLLLGFALAANNFFLSATETDEITASSQRGES